MDTRNIRTTVPGKPTIEGAGVHLKRIFGYSDVPLLDPFLLLDDFSSDNPDDYQGFQLWVNLPSSHTMMNPRYRGIQSEQIPEVSVDENTTVKIICGEVQGIRGPVGDIVVETEYLDCPWLQVYPLSVHLFMRP